MCERVLSSETIRNVKDLPLLKPDLGIEHVPRMCCGGSGFNSSTEFSALKQTNKHKSELHKPCPLANICDPSTRETDAGGL